jgi:N-acetylglucosaminyl-diphospho-decaprenol L-rhamnosyltransferase
VIDLSIVVATWNTCDLTLGCLRATARALERGADRALEAEVIVVDNGSSDGTAGAVRRLFPGAQVIALPRNVGFAAACNAGLRAMRGRHALLLNSDARPLPGALETCVRFLDTHPDVGVVGPRLLRADGAPQSSIHRSPALTAELIPLGLLRLLFRRRFPSERRLGSDPVDVEAVRGAALFARSSLIRAVGPLAEEYFFFLEETEWCERIRRAGWRVVYHPGASVVHLSGESSKRPHPALTRIEYHRSLYRFYRTQRGRGRAALVRGLRLAKTGFYLLSQAPLALCGRPHRVRWRVHRDVLAWHLRGCPASVGLAGLGGGAGRR